MKDTTAKGMQLKLRRAKTLAMAGAALLTMSGQALAGDWEMDAGIRYWYSTGKAAKDLFDSTGTLLLSRLTYSKLAAHTGEGFMRLDHNPTGVFLKGYAGIGSITGGHMIDEDFPPVTVPYSATYQKQKSGNISYFNADLGYNFLDTRGNGGAGVRLGGFIGYHYYKEYPKTYGCVQIATNPAICGGGGFPTSIKTLSQDNNWHSLRIGAVADFYATDRLKVTIDAAYTRNWLRGKDHHHLRPAINPLPERGHGNGFQIEGVLSYAVTGNVTLGLGGRYWHYGKTHGWAHFEKAPGALPGWAPQVENWKSRRYGVFVQLGYTF